MVDSLAWIGAELDAVRRDLAHGGAGPGLVLALDQGGHASRAVLFDATGDEVAAAHVPIATRHPAEDRVEHDADELARSLRLAATDACDTAAAARQPVVAAGLATQRSTIVCWERAGGGRTLSAAISWQDRRNAAWLEQVRPHERRIRTLTGLPLSPHYGASKLRWCLDHLPAVAAAANEDRLAAGPLSSFLLHRLLAEQPLVVDPANASRTQLYDPVVLDWSQPLLEDFGIPRDILPRCVGTRHDFGTLDVPGRRIPLRACTGDQSAAAFGFGPPDPATAYVNVGTGAFVQRIVRSATEAPPRGLLRSVVFADEHSTIFSLEGTVNGAGSALDWLRTRSGIDVERALPTLAVDASGREPPLFMNGVGGLASPFWRTGFPIEFVGMGDDLAQLRAVVDSIAFLLAVNLEAMGRAAPLLRIVISGGLARSDYLCSVLADATGLVVERPALREATARGVAFLAADQPVHWSRPTLERTFAPSAGRSLRARYARWQQEMQHRGALTPP